MVDLERPEYLGPFVDPNVLARISDLSLVARIVVQGFISGLHRSAHLGRSNNFSQHRSYMPGDDIRQIDWRVYARTDRFFVKEYDVDATTNCTVLLDISRSMNFGSLEITKLDYARYLAASLTMFAQKQRDRVGLVTFDSDLVKFVPPSAKHLDFVLQGLDRINAHRASDYKSSFSKITNAVQRRGILVLISDLYDEPKEILNAVKGMHFKGNDLIVLHVLDPAELTFPYDAVANYRDLESGEVVSVVPEYIRDEYRELVANHLASLRQIFGDSSIDYRLFDTSTPLDFALFHFLSHRGHLIRNR